MHQTKRGVLATTFSLHFPTFIIYSDSTAAAATFGTAGLRPSFSTTWAVRFIRRQ